MNKLIAPAIAAALTSLFGLSASAMSHHDVATFSTATLQASRVDARRERPEKPEKVGAATSDLTLARRERPEKPEKPEKVGAAAPDLTLARAERPEKPEKVGRTERPEKPEKVGATTQDLTLARAERPEKPEKRG